MGEVGQPNLARNTLAVLATLVEEDNDAILVELCNRLSNVSACELAEPRLRSMREAHWDASSKSLNSPGKKTLHATERNTERVQLLRVQYWHEIGEVKLENLVFVDETGRRRSGSGSARTCL